MKNRWAVLARIKGTKKLVMEDKFMKQPKTTSVRDSDGKLKPAEVVKQFQYE